MRRYRPDEIAAKLVRAGELAAVGRTQPEICRAIGGVSVMTLHRWRKRYGDRDSAATSAPAPDGVAARLVQENERLRRIATDLLLEIAATRERRAPG